MINLDNVEKQNKTLKDIVDPYLPRKKDIVPYLEFLTGAAKSENPSLFNLAMGLPVAGKGVKLFRGISKWMPKQMVESGKYIGKKTFNPITGKQLSASKGIYTTPQKKYGEKYMNLRSIDNTKGNKNPMLLEFEVPIDYIKKHGKSSSFDLKKDFDKLDMDQLDEIFFEGGLPKKFIKKVHKYKSTYDPKWGYMVESK